MPILAFVGTADDIGQPVAAVSSGPPPAPRFTNPPCRSGISDWWWVVPRVRTRGRQPPNGSTGTRASAPARGHREDGEVPEGGQGSGVSLSSRLTHGFGSVAMAGANLTKDIADAAGSLQRTTVAVARESVRSVPMMLSRMGQIQADTQISLGKLMSENTKRGGDKKSCSCSRIGFSRTDR